MKLFNNKRANWMDIPEYIKLALYLGIVFFIGLTMLNNFNTTVQANPDISAISKTISTNALSAYLIIDYLFLFMTLLFWIVSIVLARIIPSTSRFSILGIFMIIFMPILAMIIVNIWDGFINNPTISALLPQVVWIPLIMNYLVFISFIYSLSVGVALYTKEN